MSEINVSYIRQMYLEFLCRLAQSRLFYLRLTLYTYVEQLKDCSSGEEWE